MTRENDSGTADCSNRGGTPSSANGSGRGGGPESERDGLADGRYRHLIEHVQDAVVEFDLVDGRPIVRDTNQAFVDVFGYAVDEIRGEPLNEWVVPEWKRSEAAGLDENTASGEINYRKVTRKTKHGLREFLYRGVPYQAHDEHGDAQDGGFAVYTDLTEISQNERRSKVLNRILRHNLRNNANVVAGHTTRLLAALPETNAETIEAAATIERAAHELERLADEAERIRNVLQRRTDEGAHIDPEPLVRSVVDERRQRSPNATIEVDLAEAETIFADSRLRYAVESLVDNAIEHNPSATPRVRVRITRSADADDHGSVEDDHGPSVDADETAPDSWVIIHVEDDGPRIPPHERDVIRDDTEMTPTHHGSGLGLWLTELTVETFGGEISFGTSDLGGNDVSIRLRRRTTE